MTVSSSSIFSDRFVRYHSNRIAMDIFLKESVSRFVSFALARLVSTYFLIDVGRMTHAWTRNQKTPLNIIQGLIQVLT